MHDHIEKNVGGGKAFLSGASVAPKKTDEHFFARLYDGKIRAKLCKFGMFELVQALCTAGKGFSEHP